MSDYSFTRGNRVFRVQAHNDISITKRLQADEPVRLTSTLPSHGKEIVSRLSVEHGVTFATVEDDFRHFIYEAGLPAPRKQHP